MRATRRRPPHYARQARATLAAALMLGCGEHATITAPPTPSRVAHPGFDAALYPGDAAMRAWFEPASPYQWVGYYVPAPCHRDLSWSGKRTTLASLGWGVAVLYVGQQTFDDVPFVERPAPVALDARSAPAARMAAIESVTCSRTLLSAAQGAAEALDAAAKMAAEGFPAGTVVFLDVEHMDTIPESMSAYFRAWIGGVLIDGRFRPGVYCHVHNAPPLHDAAQAVYAALGRPGVPEFWLAGGSGFTIDRAPSGAGYAYASAWQGVLEVSQAWGGVRFTIDVNVASHRSPSFPDVP